MVGNQRLGIALAASAALLLAACTDDSSGPLDAGPVTSEDGSVGAAGTGVASAWALVGTEGTDWDGAAGFWVDSDMLLGLVPTDGAGPGHGLIRSLTRTGAPMALWSPPSDPVDQGWLESVAVEPLLAETDWALQLTQMGSAPMTYWQGTDAWSTIEPSLTASEAWRVTDGRAAYVGPAMLLSAQELAVSAPADDVVAWENRGSVWQDTVGTTPSLADLESASGMLACLDGADALFFMLAPDGGQVLGGTGTGWAVATDVTGPDEATAWWCGAVPGAAEALAEQGGPPASSLGAAVVTPGTPEVIDADTLRVPLETVDGDSPISVVRAVLGAPEKTYPGY